MKRGEAGFTIVELLIAVAITGAIVAALAMTVTTLIRGSRQATEQNGVLPRVQTVGYWISRDINMARDVTLGGPNGFPLSLIIPVSDNVTSDYQVDYLFDGDKLKRRQYDSSETLVAETLITDYIDTDNTKLTPLNPVAGHFELAVRAVIGNSSLTMSYDIEQRVGLR